MYDQFIESQYRQIQERELRIKQKEAKSFFESLEGDNMAMKDATPEQVKDAISMANSLEVVLQENERLNEENIKLREVITQYNMEEINHLKTTVFSEWWFSLPAEQEIEGIEKVFNRCQFLEAENETYQRLMEKHSFRTSFPLFGEFDRWVLTWKTMALVVVIIVLSIALIVR